MGYALLVTHVLRPGHEDAFDALVEATLPQIGALEPGTLVYVSHADPDRPLLRVFYELYRDRAAFATHEAQEHVRTFLEARREHVDSVQVVVLDALAVHV